MEGGVTGIDAAAKRAVDLAFRGQLAAAGEALAQCTQLAQDERGQALALYASGVVHRCSDDYPAALADLAVAVQKAEEVGEVEVQAKALAIMGQTVGILGDSAQAIDRLTRALELAHECGDESAEAMAYRGLAAVYSRLEDNKPAVEYAGRALALARRGEDMIGVVWALLALGNVHGSEAERRGHLGLPNRAAGEKAIDSYEEAIPLARSVSSRSMEVVLVNNIAHTLRLLGRYQEAIEHIDGVLSEGTNQLTSVTVSVLYFNLGASRLGLGEAEDSLTSLREALRLAEAARSLIHLPKMHLALAEAYEVIGDTARALDHHKAYHDVERRLRGSDIRSKALVAAMRLEKEELAHESHRRREENAALTQVLRGIQEESQRPGGGASRDPLTDLVNRHTFDAWLRRIVDAAGRSPVSVALIDVDRFKFINETISHAAGDEVLRRLSVLLRAEVRHGDIAARYGGEEFALVLPGTPLSEAALVCERVRRAVADTDWSEVGADLQVTVSAGVAQEISATNALAVADQRLHAAKLAGRNRVVAH